MLTYASIGILWIIAAGLISPFLYQYYGITQTSNSLGVVILWQIAGLIAAIGAIHNQQLVAQGHYSILLVGGLLWAGIASMIPTFLMHNLTGSVFGVLCAYLVLQVFYWMISRFKISLHEDVPR